MRDAARYGERYNASVKLLNYIIDKEYKLVGRVLCRNGKPLNKRKILSYIMQTYYPKGINVRNSLHELVEKVYDNFNIIWTQQAAERDIHISCVRCDRLTFIDRNNFYDVAWELGEGTASEVETVET
ncbi:hypothetical protein FACS1894184_15380 [Clostridia bacterium]|nr:hypothetical protein FACS1894184_15380 [Clostridia bacterium]